MVTTKAAGLDKLILKFETRHCAKLGTFRWLHSSASLRTSHIHMANWKLARWAQSLQDGTEAKDLHNFTNFCLGDLSDGRLRSSIVNLTPSYSNTNTDHVLHRDIIGFRKSL
ncbi:hypothetical protein J7T55_002588 [Diaporthe amygdali]|uniref:uncharacterized protein n=1 Tax=Phomopsis amygdali TaxID=1214568 RepID=UPI0022FEB6D1|nr:uncharacterized protein J7T55_002588 [Diaporthe amygdali]KAJ0122077.1 hypothetical protein J7T55_002588 [Diaporthe amygdali]